MCNGDKSFDQNIPQLLVLKFNFTKNALVLCVQLNSILSCSVKRRGGPSACVSNCWLIQRKLDVTDHGWNAPSRSQWGGRFTNPLGIWEFSLEDVNHVYSMRIQDLCRRSIFSMNYSLVFQVWKDLGRPLTILDHAYIVNLWPQI